MLIRKSVSGLGKRTGHARYVKAKPTPLETAADGEKSQQSIVPISCTMPKLADFFMHIVEGKDVTRHIFMNLLTPRQKAAATMAMTIPKPPKITYSQIVEMTVMIEGSPLTK